MNANLDVSFQESSSFPKLDSVVSYDTKITTKTETSSAEVVGNFNAPTIAQFTALHKSFTFFNKILFANKVRPTIMVLCRSVRKANGSYSFQTWKDQFGNTFDQININPRTLNKRTAREVYSTLVHEMCHAFQHHFGKPGRCGYHNAEFAAIMERVGLKASDTGLAGGKTTGQQMGHFIISNAVFDNAFSVMPSSLLLPFAHCSAAPRVKPVVDNCSNGAVMMVGQQFNSGKNKVKYACPVCGINVWGKNGLSIICANDNQLLQ